MRDLVLKIGGSLIHHLGEILPVILASERRILIIPGGGIFAQTVRDCQVSGSYAHWMAIAGMEQYGWYIASFGIPVTAVLDLPETRVFLPYRFLQEIDPLPHSWEVTSDTIAAYVADQKEAELAVLKSVDGITREDRLIRQITEQVKTDVVDPLFIPFVLSHHVPTIIMNGRKPDRLADLLSGREVYGTSLS
ncbi:MAG: uridylate kinase [Methanospirillaceae archaeon]|nr:uridylate kinase [Methanospirillaceae archaeon]